MDVAWYCYLWGLYYRTRKMYLFQKLLIFNEREHFLEKTIYRCLILYLTFYFTIHKKKKTINFELLN
jgi:hypothetical protein